MSALLNHLAKTFTQNFPKEIEAQISKKRQSISKLGRTARQIFKEKLETLHPDQLRAIYKPRSSSSRLSRTIVRDDRRPNTSLNATSTGKRKIIFNEDKDIVVKQSLGFERMLDMHAESPNKSYLSTNDKTL